MRTLKVGFIGPISGHNGNIGQGLLASFNFIMDHYRPALASKGVDVGVTELDDKSDPFLSLQRARDAYEAGCAVVVGPAGSAEAFAVAKVGQFWDMPFILSFATNEDPNLVGAGCFFRTTSPASRRADVMIRQVKKDFPNSQIRLLVLDGPDHSYSVHTHNAVARSASYHGVRFTGVPFSMGRAPLLERKSRAPVVISAPSYEGGWLLSELRRQGLRAAAYGFGSNTNWLTPSSAGLTVVCDLDRSDPNPVVSEFLRNFSGAYQAVKDPSVSTMLAGLVVVQLAEGVLNEEAAPIHIVRRKALSQLRHSTFKGIVGDVKFGSGGEMIGYEQISVLKVVARRGICRFQGVERAPPSIVSDQEWLAKKVLAAVNVAAAFAGIAGLLIAVLALAFTTQGEDIATHMGQSWSRLKTWWFASEPHPTYISPNGSKPADRGQEMPPAGLTMPIR